MNKIAMLACAVSCVAAVAGTGLAQNYTEDFPDPMGGWTTRWFYQNSNAESYYVTSGNCDIDYRGNNPCGLWITDSQGCGSGGIGGPVCSIEFDPVFGASIQSIAFDLSAYTSQGLTIYDMSNNVVLEVPSVELTFNNCAGFRYSATSNNGISKVVMDSSNVGSGQIEGNTAWDNIEVIAGPAGLSLNLTGPCPGTIGVAWANATPSRTMGIVFANSTGSFAIPGGPCGGTRLGLGSAGLRLVRTLSTGNGSGQVNGAAGTAACGHYLQLVVSDGNPCATSNTAEIR